MPLLCGSSNVGTSLLSSVAGGGISCDVTSPEDASETLLFSVAGGGISSDGLIPSLQDSGTSGTK